MNNVMTPVEQYLVSEWAGDKKTVIDRLLGASGLSLALGRDDDAEDMILCARMAFDIIYDASINDDVLDVARERMLEAAWELEP